MSRIRNTGFFNSTADITYRYLSLPRYDVPVPIQYGIHFYYNLFLISLSCHCIVILELNSPFLSTFSLLCREPPSHRWSLLVAAMEVLLFLCTIVQNTSVGNAVLFIWDLLRILQSFSCGLLNPVKILKGLTDQIRLDLEWYHRKVRWLFLRRYRFQYFWSLKFYCAYHTAPTILPKSI
jgi:hypothetical protein